MTGNEYFRMRYDLKMDQAQERAEIMVYGEICTYKWDDADMTAKDFDKLIKDARANGAKKLHLRINSPGGAVYQAVAMRTMLLNGGFEEMTATIEGICASAATLLVCVPGMHVMVAEGSEFMIHNPRTMTAGTAADFEKSAERLRKLESDFQAMYAGRCGHDGEEIKKLMDAETWFTAKEAVDYGFCDELLQAEEIAACVTGEQMEAMKRMYGSVPAAVAIREAGQPDSNAETAQAGEATVHRESEREEETSMEIGEITMEQLQAGNRAVYDSVFQAGAAAERERIQDIDDLTPAGYEDMARQAKEAGTSAMDFHKAVIRAQREKGKDFLTQRQKETAPAAGVAGSAAEDDTADANAEERAAKELAELARAQHDHLAGGMY